MSKIFDITPLISEKIAVFPGDQKFQRNVILDVEKDDHISLSNILSTVHLGAHTDAPNHYAKNSEGIADRDLNYYLGPAQVITVLRPLKSRIQVKDIESIEIKAQRVLFKTNSFPDPDQWNADFVSLSSDVVNYLYSKKVCLIGIDTPSIDLSDDKILESHTAIHKNNMAILEGLVLNDVNDGEYTLIALPLKIKDADASPVRAVLISGAVEDLWKK